MIPTMEGNAQPPSSKTPAKPSAARGACGQKRRDSAKPGHRREGEALTRGWAGDAVEPAPVLPRQWHLLLAALFATALVSAIIGQTLPSGGTLIAFLSAGLLLSASRASARSLPVPDYVILFALGLVPQALIGWGFARWMVPGDLAWALGAMSILVIGMMLGVLLGQRPFQLFFAKVSLWSPVALNAVVHDYLMAAVALAVAIIGGASVAYFQHLYDRKREGQRQADERLRNRSIDIMRDYEATGQGWFWETDHEGRITYISPEFADRYGFDHDDLLGNMFTKVFEVDPDDREAERTIKFHFTAQSVFHDQPVCNRRPGSDEVVWWSINGRPIFDGFDEFCGFRGSGTDLTERRRSAERASRLAMYDSLTGLANRHTLAQSLSKLLTELDASKRTCTILMLDLDRFKHVNDTFGHPTGDALLGQVARRLEKVVGDLGLVGRIGGDEFQVLISRRCDQDAIERLAGEIIHTLSQPYSVDGTRLVIGVSVGIALAPDHGSSSEGLIRSADLALYAAKDAGRGRFRLFSEDLHVAARERNQLEEELRSAIDKGDLELHYQPVVHAGNETLAGFEALLRWKHPKHGWISPEKFVPVAEDAGLIPVIGEWALKRACADLARWPEAVRCAVNVSPLQFADPGLPGSISAALTKYGVEPSRLELEITESVFLSEEGGTEATFAALKKIGVRLALDDFGTGYSSLGYLKNAPFDKIKIDQGFVRGATMPGSRNGAIIAAISSLAEALGMDTTAEGVETMDELELVRMHGCSHIQGYIYSKPLSPAEANRLLEAGLAMQPTGPRAAREPRQAMLRRVVLQHGEDFYNATVRNVSSHGAMIEGLWNVPEGTVFRIALSENLAVDAEVRWCCENRIGVEFAQRVRRDENGRITGVEAKPRSPSDGEQGARLRSA
ncbi:EAL domain-containing protein [Citromicrobium sp. JLT1363]|uniref:EAL domain-containing protein n=1 Tax=Citromicrobium sp. JLT1363 TaxID=517722 RepID=UPI000225E7BC|nr:EAL domain-containing protein [Citromicrobium sp. JLT1363]